ncbi:MAG TPA: serine/threonine-protein kinase [Polyangiaceae bacterium]|nr:serine/threonine-protein kinase [Polyangiaceae bacterium]
MVAEGEAGARRETFDVDALVGSVLNGRFQIRERIARGGMANVYYATQTPLNRPVAVKVLHGVRNVEAESEESFRGRFLQEASILAKLQHPNIVVLLDYGQIDDFAGEHYFMAMEYLRGETLAQRFRGQGRLSIEESIRLTRQIGRGLREAHRSGFVHRDLKPSNIILVPEDADNYIVKLVDFGVGKVVPDPATRPAALAVPRPEEDVTRAGLLLGSPRYMSPEQIRSKPIELRTDIYALGVIFFQALTGRLPFEAQNEVDLLMAHCLAPAPRIDEICPDGSLPASLARLVAGMLEKRPEDRPKVEEFLEELALIEDEVFGSVNLAGPTLQSLMPSLPASRKRQDSIAPSSSNTSAWRVRTGSAVLPNVTLAPTSSGGVESPQLKRKKLWLLAPLALLPLFLWLGLRTTTRAPSQPTESVASAVQGAAAVPTEKPAEKPEPKTFDLSIESEPSQALVSEDGIVLGRTPLALAIEHSSVVEKPRRFVLRREGYAPYAIEQRDSNEPVRLSLKLVPGSGNGAPTGTARRPTRKTLTPATPKETAAPKRSGDTPNLDIRLRR